MEYLRCPKCNTSSYENPSMKLLVNICGHKLCDTCVELIFVRPSGACPECGVILRRNQFRLQQFEDSHTEKEVDIRKKILKDYNKTERDFGSLREYNDYLEEVETLIFNLANNTDVEETKGKVESYRKQNQTIIAKNRERMLRQDKVLVTQLQQERVELEIKNKEAQDIERRVAQQKKKEKDSIIDELIHSDRPATEVLACHAATSGKADGVIVESAVAKKDFMLPSHHAQMGTAVFDPLPTHQGSQYVYQPPVFQTRGPEVPDLEQIESLGYLSGLKELEDHHLGTGFVPACACQRALQEAFSCLLLKPEDRS